MTMGYLTTHGRGFGLVKATRLIAGFGLCAAVLACASTADTVPPVAAPEQPPNAQSLQSFDQVWNQVREQYFDFPRIAAEWDQAREVLRPQAANARNAAELRPVLIALLEGIGESHFGVLPGDSQSQIESVSASQAGAAQQSTNPPRSTSTGLSARMIDQALIITEVEDPSIGPIRAGWRLDALGDLAIQPLIDQIQTVDDETARKRAVLLLEASINTRLAYPLQGEVLSLRLRDTVGVSHDIDLQGRAGSMRTVKIGTLPPMPFEFASRRIETTDGCIGLMGFSTWVPELMDRFMDTRDDLFACQGLVIDLRGNLGGVLSTMMPLTSHLVDTPILLGSLLRADGRIDFRVFPRRVADDGRRLTPFSGPVVVLIDGLSASTSEMFASGMQAIGRARIIGQRSPGMALPAQMLPLANGDVLMYAFADYHDGQGRRVEGVGVVPDQLIEPSVDALTNAEDAELDAAVSWLLQETVSRQ
ncbi:MAG: S41 family peptidase [Pseudomonadota bacterium]